MPVSARWIKSALSLSVVLALLLLALPVLAGPSAQTSGPTVVINTGALNQRTGPGLEYAIQGAVPGGSEWPVVGRTADRSWWEISTDVGIGWVNNEYVVTRGSFRGVPVVTEFGLLEVAKAIVIGLPLTGYNLPNPGGQVLGQAPTDSAFPIVARSYFSGSETWYWLVETTSGQVWLPETEGLALYGFYGRTPTLTRDEAFALPRSTPAPNGLLLPPPAAPVPDAPVAPSVDLDALTAQPASNEDSTSGADDTASAAPTVTTTPAPAAPVEVYSLDVNGDCSALALVNYLIQQSPVYATGLACTDSASGSNAVALGIADLGISVDASCGTVQTVPVATLTGAVGTHSLNFCISAAPNTVTRSFITWVTGPAGSAAIRSYQGLPGDTSAPEAAQPINP